MKRRAAATVKYAFLLFLAALELYPLLWVITSSFKTVEDIFRNPWGPPRSFQTDTFAALFRDYGLHRNVWNSFWISSLTCVLLVILSVMASYGITRMRWRLSGAAKGVFLLGMLVPLHATLIPLYVNLQWLKDLVDARLVIVIPYLAFGFSLAILILCGYFEKLPQEMEESAVIDGCSIIRAFMYIILPLTVPSIVTVAIFSFTGTWNELLFGMVFLSRDEEQTIPVAIMRFVGLYTTDWTKVLGSITIAIVPSMVLYVFAQNKIIQGVTAGSVKM